VIFKSSRLKKSVMEDSEDQIVDAVRSESYRKKVACRE